ncbi:MAG: hypothetical protein V8Q46_03900 [Bifidobacterium angulatum]
MSTLRGNQYGESKASVPMCPFRHFGRLSGVAMHADRIGVRGGGDAIRVEQPAMQTQAVVAVQCQWLFGVFEPFSGFPGFPHAHFLGAIRSDDAFAEYGIPGLGVDGEAEHSVGCCGEQTRGCKRCGSSYDAGHADDVTMVGVRHFCLISDMRYLPYSLPFFVRLLASGGLSFVCV